MQKKSPEDDFDLGYRGGHDEIALRAMSYVKLCTELEDAKPGTTKHMLLECEKRRRDSIPASEPAVAEPHHASKPAPKPSIDEKHWSDKPLGKIWLGIVTAVLIFIALYLLRTHLGIS